MKTRAALLFASLLYILSPGDAQAQCNVQTTTNYAVSYSVAPNSAGTDILTSVLLDGNSSMQMQTGCPDSIVSQFNANKQYIQHWPSVQNKIGSVGGWTQGPPSCAECYISYQTTVDSGPVNPGQQLTFTYNGQTYCSTAGIVFFPLTSYFDGEIAYTRSINTGIIAGTVTINGTLENAWRILPYCTPPTSPPDYNPPLYFAATTRSFTSVYYVEQIAACLRISGTGIFGWVCTPGAALGRPQSDNLLPANCTHTP